jgi:hypothetical protein
MVSPQARRKQVAFVCQRGLSKGRACGLIGIARSGLSYALRMPDKDAPATEAAVIALSALRLSAHPHLLRTRRPDDGNWACRAYLAAGQAAAATQAASATHCHYPPKTSAAAGR